MVVAINHFVTDTDKEVQAIKDYVSSMGSEAIVSKHWEFGSKGSEELAKRIVDIVDSNLAKFESTISTIRFANSSEPFDPNSQCFDTMASEPIDET